ncbi:MAG: alpha/beta hydrolase [Gemmatimonadota bacterium]
MSTRALPWLLPSLLLAGCTGGGEGASLEFDRSGECFVVVEASLPHDCGWVTVPGLHGRSGTGTVELGVVRLRSPARGDASAPLLFLQGGPGDTFESMLAAVTGILLREREARNTGEPAGPLSRILARRDLVFMEQRGALHSRPALSCPGASAAPWEAARRGLDRSSMEALYRTALEACVDRLESSGIDLAAFSPEQSVQDVDAVRRALGHRRVVLWGASWGADLARLVMDRYPETVEAAVLDAAGGPGRPRWMARRARAFQDVMDAVNALCQDDPECQSAFGDLGVLADAALAYLEEEPRIHPFTNGDDAFDLELTPERFAGVADFTLRSALLSSYPEFLRRIASGDLAFAGGFAGASARPGASSTLEIAHRAMVCSHDTPPLEPSPSPPFPPGPDSSHPGEGLSSLARAYVRAHAWSYAIACDVLDLEPSADPTAETTPAQAPVLLLAGRLDTRVGIQEAQDMATAFPGGRLVVFPFGRHVQFPWRPCASRLVADFLADPASLQTLDSRCAYEEGEVRFVLPQDLEGP